MDDWTQIDPDLILVSDLIAEATPIEERRTGGHLGLVQRRAPARKESARGRSRRIRPAAHDSDNSRFATPSRIIAARGQPQLKYTRGLPSAVQNVRRERRITFGAGKFGNPRGRINSVGHARAPVMCSYRSS
jgi:hypothetical protein